MKYRSIACPKYLIYCLGHSAIPILFSLIMVAITTESVRVTSITITVFLVAIYGVALYKGSFRNATRWFEMTDACIKNNDCTLEWTQIEDVHTVSIKEYRWRVIPWNFAQVVVIGNCKEENFRKLNPKECVFFVQNERNMKRLKHFAYGKSEQLDKFIYNYERANGTLP